MTLQSHPIKCRVCNESNEGKMQIFLENLTWKECGLWHSVINYLISSMQSEDDMLAAKIKLSLKSRLNMM